MNWGLRLIEGPAVEPVTLDNAKLHAKVEVDDEDELIEEWITAARELAEETTQRALITQSWTLFLDAFPSGGIKVPKPPLQSVDEIRYVDSGGTQQVLDTDLYGVDTASEPGFISPAYGTDWPTTRDQINAVQIDFTAGFGADPASVPAKIRQAIRLIVANWILNREQGIEVDLSEIPSGADMLLWRERVFGIML